MENEIATSLETKFSKEIINQQLQRIFQDPLFMNSDILRRFLSFIVEQTLRGHADWLKEYTIGVNVLNKPSNFKPGEDGIVRIHAGRLRRALNHYFGGLGAHDAVHISVPKGSYIPVFNDPANRPFGESSKTDDEITVGVNGKFINNKSPVIAVIPFQHFNNETMENSLTDGLGLQLSTALMELEKYSVIAYYTMRNLCEKTTAIPTIASSLGVQYFLTGNIQSMEGKVRVHTQMIDGQTSQQLWCCMHEGKFSAENIFDLQDQIVKLIISKIDDAKFSKEKTESVFITAVA
jgi:TolB-like protein